MIKVIDVATTRQIEKAADESGLSYDAMMQNAGWAVASRVLEVLNRRMDGDPARITVLVGPGNNGGDGLVAARLIAQQSGALVRCYLLKRRADDDPHLKAARDAGIFIANAEDDQRFRVLSNMIASAHLIIDALFGIGVRLPLAGEAEKLLKAVHQALKASPEVDLSHTVLTPTVPGPTPAPAYVVAVDCPSGLNADTGEIDKNALVADETVTFIGAKPGLFEFPGASYVGKLSVAPIGVAPDMPALENAKHTLVDADMVRQLLPARSDGSNKGTFGKALVVGGSVNYTGAVALAAEAAYRVGAGLVTVGAPGAVLTAVAAHLTEATWIVLPHDLGVLASQAAAVLSEELGAYDALLLGPGMGREATTREMIELLINPSPTERRVRRPIGFGAVRQSESEATAERVTLPPLVIDADGLNLLAEIEDWPARLPAQTVLTPHPGEMARLIGSDVKTVLSNRWALVAEKAAEWKVILVLKGAHTLIAAPDGRIAVLPFKTAALATAGTGDVLAGMIVGFLAQGLNGFDAAVCAGYLHGLAGSLMAEQMGTRAAIAGDILRYGLPQALQDVDAG